MGAVPGCAKIFAERRVNLRKSARRSQMTAAKAGGAWQYLPPPPVRYEKAPRLFTRSNMQNSILRLASSVSVFVLLGQVAGCLSSGEPTTCTTNETCGAGQTCSAGTCVGAPTQTAGTGGSTNPSAGNASGGNSVVAGTGNVQGGGGSKYCHAPRDLAAVIWVRRALFRRFTRRSAKIFAQPGTAPTIWPQPAGQVVPTDHRPAEPHRDTTPCRPQRRVALRAPA